MLVTPSVPSVGPALRKLDIDQLLLSAESRSPLATVLPQDRRGTTRRPAARRMPSIAHRDPVRLTHSNTR